MRERGKLAYRYCNEWEREKSLYIKTCNGRKRERTRQRWRRPPHPADHASIKPRTSSPRLRHRKPAFHTLNTANPLPAFATSRALLLSADPAPLWQGVHDAAGPPNLSPSQGAPDRLEPIPYFPTTSS